ncbi:MAG: UDP-3-O-(3-hydroxymyristoyl)glucosamine N-acyltransferase [Alphaproteobacteria bacterium]|nr:UDP-3-O-(3-hydroxymyristoyl)glucosamine N-acyltransferase [Alphaproteobacteria bacterium]
MKKLLMKLFGPKARKTTAGALAEKFGLELRGAADTEIKGIAPIADAAAGQLTFYSTEQNAAAFKILPIETLQKTKASVIVVQPEFVKKAPKSATLLITESPRGAMVKILGEIYAEPKRRGISRRAYIERGVFFRDKKSCYVGPFVTIRRGAVIEAGVTIDSGAYIGPAAVIGANTEIAANAFVDNVTMGADCVIKPNATVGREGFGYTRQDGKNTLLPHAGRVILGARVSVGANSIVDRGMMADTRIGDGTKVDSGCYVSHGVVIGRECFLAGGTGVAGGVVAGDNVLFGAQCGIANKVQIGDNVEIGAKSGVFQNVPSGSKILGYPAINGVEFLRMFAWTRKQVKKQTA